MKKQMTLGFLAAACLSAWTLPSKASDRAAAIALTNEFYAAIAPGQDAAAMRSRAEDLLASDVVFDLRDLGISQNKSAFLDSLEGWSDAIDGGFIAHVVDGVIDDTVSVRVCYDFGDDMAMNREIFVVKSARIAKSAQIKVADNCDAF